MNEIKERIGRLREKMADRNIDFVLIPTADFHGSEYIGDYFKTREYFSGFTGSAGTLLVGKCEALLWTDGRYYLQAEAELRSSEITLMKMEPEVPSLTQWLKNEKKRITESENNIAARKDLCLACDARLISTSLGKQLADMFPEDCLIMDFDPAEGIWIDRPTLSGNMIYMLDDDHSGQSSSEKLRHFREKMKENNLDYFFISKLDDLMWLFNIRGSDVACNPVALCYAWIGLEEAAVFLRHDAVNASDKQKLQEYFQSLSATICDYDGINSFWEEHSILIGAENRQNTLRIGLDSRSTGYFYYKILADFGNIVDLVNPTEVPKAIKNLREIELLRKTYLLDSAAVCKFIYRLKKELTDGIMHTEMSAAQMMDDLRREIPGYLDLSFPTISGYASNGAIVHYEATDKTNKTLELKGLLLVDSGGQYNGGTTDVTRTIALGPVTDEERFGFTMVACANLKLAEAVFPEGCTGRNLDILAREYFWKHHLDYRHGTGHGIGFVLNVHEGPQNIRWRYIENLKEQVLLPGMLISDEPGIYIENNYGVRTESIVLVEERERNEYGRFLGFELLTYVPIDRDALDVSLMSKEDIRRINAYHKTVFRKIAKYMTDSEVKWLEEATKPLDE